MKQELEKSSNRHAERLLADLSEVMELPRIATERIRREINYATMDGYRITMKFRNGGMEYDEEISGNR
jgi:hypothetical protein